MRVRGTDLYLVNVFLKSGEGFQSPTNSAVLARLVPFIASVRRNSNRRSDEFLFPGLWNFGFPKIRKHYFHVSVIVFRLADGGHFGASLFFFFGPGVGLLWPASVLLSLRVQIGISCFGARLPFPLHLLHEIECGFIGSIRSSVTYSLTCLEAKM